MLKVCASTRGVNPSIGPKWFLHTLGICARWSNGKVAMRRSRNVAWIMNPVVAQDVGDNRDAATV